MSSDSPKALIAATTTDHLPDTCTDEQVSAWIARLLDSETIVDDETAKALYFLIGATLTAHMDGLADSERRKYERSEPHGLSRAFVRDATRFAQAIGKALYPPHRFTDPITRDRVVLVPSFRTAHLVVYVQEDLGQPASVTVIDDETLHFPQVSEARFRALWASAADMPADFVGSAISETRLASTNGAALPPDDVSDEMVRGWASGSFGTEGRILAGFVIKFIREPLNRPVVGLSKDDALTCCGRVEAYTASKHSDWMPPVRFSAFDGRCVRWTAPGDLVVHTYMCDARGTYRVTERPGVSAEEAAGRAVPVASEVFEALWSQAVDGQLGAKLNADLQLGILLHNNASE